MKLICYLSNGYPTSDHCIKLADKYVEAGADVIEIDVPCFNPYLEGAQIAGRMKEVLANNDNYEDYLNNIATIKNKHPNTQFIVMAYESTILDIGFDHFVEFLKTNNLLDTIVVGDEKQNIKEKLMKEGIRVTCYVQLKMLEDEIAAAKKSDGFVYVQAKAPQEDIHPDYPTLKDCLIHLKDCGLDKHEFYCGVGVHTSEDVRMVKEAGADGAFIGKAILEYTNDFEKLVKTIQEYKEVATE